ncbi:MAG: dephospho-CoA kinase [Tepidisphaeraceae bacterium]
MYVGKPVIGIAGGIGSGKSFIAKLFAGEGCLVIDSDQQVSDAYRDEAVRETLRQWWGDAVIRPDGQINRRLIGAKVFSDAGERRRLEELIHPRVNAARERAMAEAARNPRVVAFVWDTPLLFETGLNGLCDAVVFVEASLEDRIRRVAERSGWDAAELARRENSQWPLDRKRGIADYVVRNTADTDFARSQVKDALFQIVGNKNRFQT